MAEYTAIVEAGEALVSLLRENMTPEPVAKKELISLCSPHESDNNVLTVYLFHIEEDQHSTQQGYFMQGENTERAYPAVLNLSFLVTAISKAPPQLREADDQYRVLGRAVQVLRDNALIDSRYLSGSLAATGTKLHVSIERPPFDQMIKIWNNTQTPYKLSIVVNIGGVSIDSGRTREVTRVSDLEIGVKKLPDAKNAR